MSFKRKSPLKIVGHGKAVAAEPETERQSNIAAWMCISPTGRWIVSYRAACDKNNTRQRVMMTWSDDQGKTWSKPITPFTDRKLNGKIGQFRAMACTALGNGHLVASLWWVDASNSSKSFFNEETEGILDSHCFLSTSEDDGKCWSAPVRINTAPFDHFPCPLTGPVLFMPNGDWAFQFEPNRPYDPPVPLHHYMPAMIFSRDHGKTWSGTTQPALDPQHHICYGDQRPSVLSDGTVIDFFWTLDSRNGKPLNIHASCSRDSGRTWSPVWDTGVPGQPGPARSLPDGRIALVFVDRTGAPSIKLRISDDGGRTFPGRTELTLHQPGLGSQTREKRNIKDLWTEIRKLYSVGLPDSKLLPNGDLIVTFYTGPRTDQTDIDWVRLAVK
ncbi:MAG: exo-alpha-sialidase [Verrucomicrobia bacterium]|nr:exo-alpha-sialidase [Verrucomicrobiota bacterium]